MILPTDGRAVLVAVASRPEIAALWPRDSFAFWEPRAVGPGVEAVLTGLGKANAAGAVARALRTDRHAGVLCVGVGGCLPGSGLELARVVAGEAAVFSDEGVETPGAFVPAADLGFPAGIEGDEVAADAGWIAALRAFGLPVARIATVSVCSGLDARAEATAKRTGASVEAMEGAAVGLVAARLGVAFAEIRAVSNTTGDRSAQRWDLPGALTALASVVHEVLGE